jgi:hypothetical protein
LIPGGNVGIGTANPTVKLQVNGGTAGSSATIAKFTNSTNDQRVDIIDEGSAYGQGTGLYTGTGFGLRLWAAGGPVSLTTGGGSDIVLVATGSSVGIGTINPTHQLSLSRPSQTTAYQFNINNAGGISDGNYTGIRFSQDSDASTELGNIKLHYYSTGATALSLGTRFATQAIFIDNTR